MIELDGTFGEGGGQILRTALGLSAATGTPFRIGRIRGHRRHPGLQRQHLACVEAMGEITGARTVGARMLSESLEFEPGPVRAGSYRFEISTAGSTTLLAQAVLPALLCADGPSELTLSGGTHNNLAPPFDFFAEVFLPTIAVMGFHARARLRSHGFYPRGGGEIVLHVDPWRKTAPAEFDLTAPVVETQWSGRIYDSMLPAQVAAAQRSLLRKAIPDVAKIEHRKVFDSRGPGNCVMVVGHWDGHGQADAEAGAMRGPALPRRTILTAFGAREKRSTAVMAELAAQFERFVESASAVDEHLADQLLVYMALAGHGRFATGPLSPHAVTNMAIIEKFLPVCFAVEADKGAGRTTVAASTRRALVT